MAAQTINVVDRLGNFELVGDDGRVHARGRARVSVTKPEYVTLVFESGDRWSPGTPIRVPADWVAALDKLPKIRPKRDRRRRGR